MSERRMPSVEDYPSNAKGSKTENRPALRGGVKKKAGIFKSMKDEFISEDVEYMGSDLVENILFPTLRDLVMDLCHSAIDTIFNGGGGYSRRRGGRGSYISYNRYFDDRDRRRRRSRRDRDDDDYYDDDRGSRRRAVLDCSEYKFDYKEDAEDVFDMLCDRLEQYGEVTVAYFFDKIGETIPGAWTGEDWGWTNFSGVKVRGSSRNGWYIDLPRAKEL